MHLGAGGGDRRLQISRRVTGGVFSWTLSVSPPKYTGHLELLTSSVCHVVWAGYTLVQGLSYLVDPASSHMLVSKIKPCMCKYKSVHGETANGSLNQLWFLRLFYSLDNCS